MMAEYPEQSQYCLLLVLVLVLELDELVSRNFHVPISIQCLCSLFLNALVCGNALQLLTTQMLKTDSRAIVEHLVNVQK